jgi:hypothetical protein
MKVKKLLLAGLVAAGSLGLMPAAHATECVPNVNGTDLDDKVVGHTCWDCGWVMIRGDARTLFYCD